MEFGLLETLPLFEASVETGSSESGPVLLQMPDGEVEEAHFLRTSSAPIPSLRRGDSVLVIRARERAYVLGIVESKEKEEDVLRLRSGRIILEAGQELEIRCGDAMIHIDGSGNVVARGETVTTRSRAENNVQGGTVNIN